LPGGYVPDVIQSEPQRVNLADNIAPDIVCGFIRVNQGYGMAVFIGHAEQQFNRFNRVRGGSGPRWSWFLSPLIHFIVI
jgi:hypothetical protein